MHPVYDYKRPAWTSFTSSYFMSTIYMYLAFNISLWHFIDAKDFRCTMSIWECKWCASGNFSGKSFFCTLWYCVCGFYSNSLQCTHALLLNRGIWVVQMFEDLSLSLTLWLGHKDTGMKLPAVVLRLFSCLDRLLPKVPGVLIPLKLQVTAPDLVVQPGTL